MSSLSTMQQTTRCPDIPPDMLHEISSRIHDAADFVRFHAVCKPWRQSHELATRKKTTDQFLPWLLASNMNKVDSLSFRCIFSKFSYLSPAPLPVSCTGINFVASADGTAIRFFTADSTLTDPVTGDITHLPLFLDDQWYNNPSGITYGDGTILLYGEYRNSHGRRAEYRAALLRPGDDEWTVVQRPGRSIDYCVTEFCATFHVGKILVTVERRIWEVVTTTTTLTVDDPVLTTSSMPIKHDGYFYQHGYVLEAHGELMWASVHITTDYLEEHRKGTRNLVHSLRVSVHALEEARWVRKNGKSLGNLVLFLGWPNSFSMDASRLGIDGGFAYFLYTCGRTGGQLGVYRYNLIDNTTDFMEWLPHGCHRERCTWLLAQPTITLVRSP